jgi:hypothetical protein
MYEMAAPLQVNDVVVLVEPHGKRLPAGTRAKILVTDLPGGLITIGLGRPERADEHGAVFLIRPAHLRTVTP